MKYMTCIVVGGDVGGGVCGVGWGGGGDQNWLTPKPAFVGYHQLLLRFG